MAFSLRRHDTRDGAACRRPVFRGAPAVASHAEGVPAQRAKYDAVIVGSGPNGLAAAITLARAGCSVLVVEARDTPGGGCRTGEATLPGVRHDHCSSVHPLGVASPFFRSLALERHGLELVYSDAEVAHLLPDGRAVTLERSIAATAAQLGADAAAYTRLFEPLVAHFAELVPMLLAPLRWPEHPWLMARFGVHAVHSMRTLARVAFAERPARALLAGLAAHSTLPLEAPASAAFALVLGAAGHAVGWPLARGGSQAITSALLACLRELGGELELGHEVHDLDELPPASAYVLDVTPRQLLALAGRRLPSGYRRRLERYRYGPGVCKLDWALHAPIPWKDPRCARAATVHLSGHFSDLAAAEAAVHEGRLPPEPFVLLVQPTLFDPTRAPRGTHVAWAYCHVPHGSPVDASAAIEAHIERHAPGFRDTISARAVRNAPAMERYNPNYVGGDINGGSPDLGQLFFRPVARLDPYATPAPEVFLCSSSTPPGGGVHGMCGYWAGRSVLRHLGVNTRRTSSPGRAPCRPGTSPTPRPASAPSPTPGRYPRRCTG
jgi:phytoene dehydrogenase-like protein